MLEGVALSKHNFYPVILAGGSGTRFWPRSRRSRAKQVLALDREKSHTMIQQTLARLAPLSSERDFWIITNELLAPVIRRQLPHVPPKQVAIEPAARNTAPAIGLAAFILERQAPGAILGMFPADHVIADAHKFRKTVRHALAIASKEDTIAVMFIQPPRPHPGLLTL